MFGFAFTPRFFLLRFHLFLSLSPPNENKSNARGPRNQAPPPKLLRRGDRSSLLPPFPSSDADAAPAPAVVCIGGRAAPLRRPLQPRARPRSRGARHRRKLRKLQRVAQRPWSVLPRERRRRGERGGSFSCCCCGGGGGGGGGASSRFSASSSFQLLGRRRL